MAATGTERAARWCRDFGYRVRVLREDAGLSQADLAARAEVHVTYLSAVERGKRNISLVNIRALAEALDVPAATLFE
jgi:transcriptional regulator with XRE-family HTH domain